MKKITKIFPAFIVLILSLAALNGCSTQPQEQTGIDQAPRDRRIGVIQSLGGVTTSSQGTDLLTMDDGTTILLKSTAINLDDAKYLSKKVEVSGVLTYTTDSKQIMEVESIDVLDETPVTQQQAVVSWRDYVNAGLGFRVKYRDDFKVSENNQMISFTRPISASAMAEEAAKVQNNPDLTMELSQSHDINIFVKSHPAGQTVVKDLLKLADDKSATLLAAGYSKSRIGSDGLEAYKLVDADGTSVTFSFESGGNFYQITYLGGKDSQSLEDQNVFYDFLASFQLLNGSPASTQQTTEGDTANNPTPQTPPPAQETPAAASVTVTPPSTATSPDTTTTSTDTAPPATTTSDTTAVTPSETQELLPGYSSFVSTGYKFSLQYPKGWYYGQTTTDDSTVIRRYDFGSKPVDEEPGSVNLDIVSGSIPSGSSVTVGDKTLVQTTSGATVTYYYKSDSGRIYRVSGPSSMQTSLKNMLGTLEQL